MTARAPESLPTPTSQPERASLFAGLAVAVVGAAMTFHLSSSAGELGGFAARRQGEEIAMAGAVLSVMWAIVAARFARGLSSTRRGSDAVTRRLAAYTSGVALASGAVAAGATWWSFEAAYAASNASRSMYRRLEMGAFEAFVAGAVGAGLFFAVLRAGDASPSIVAGDAFFGDEPDDEPEASPRPGALVAASAGALAFVVVTLVLGHVMDWAGLTAAAVSLAAAAVVYEALRPAEDAEGGWPRIRAGVAALFGVVSFGLGYRAIAFAYAQGNASSSFRWDRQEMGQIEIGIAGAVAAAVVIVALIATRTRHARAAYVRRFTLHKLVRSGLAVGVMFGLAFVAIAYLEWHGLLSLGAGGIGGAVFFIVTRPSLRSMAGGDVDVGEALGQLDRAGRRSTAALIASGVVGLAVFGMLWMVLSALRMGGLTHFFGIIAASAAAGLMVHRALKAPEGDASYQGLLDEADGADIDIFSDSLEGAQSIEVNQNVSLASLLMGGVTKSSYQLRAGQSWCGEAKEKSGLFSRLFIGGRRALDVEVGDGGEEPSMRLERPFVWWRNRAVVWVGDRQVGTIRRRWSPFRRSYVVHDANGQELFTLLSGAILWWRRRFQILQGGRAVGEMQKLKLPWYKRMFRSPLVSEQDRFHLELPPDADLDARRLLVGSTLMVDITHFPPTQNARVGGLVFAAMLGLLSLAAPAPDDTRTAGWGDHDGGTYAAPVDHRPQSAWEGRPRTHLPAAWNHPDDGSGREPVLPAPTTVDEEPFESDPPSTRPSFLDTDDAVAQIRAAAKSERRRMLAQALEDFAHELYGPGYASIARALAKTSDDHMLELAVLPLASRHLGARGCLKEMKAAMTKSSARELTKCRPDGERLPLSARKLGRVNLWAAALALDLELKARDEGTETDPLHRLAVKVLLAQR